MHFPIFIASQMDISSNKQNESIYCLPNQVRRVAKNVEPDLNINFDHNTVKNLFLGN